MSDEQKGQQGQGIPPLGLLPGQHHHAAPQCTASACTCAASYGTLKSCTWDSNAGSYLCSHEVTAPH